MSSAACMAAAIGDIVTQEYAALLREYRVLQVTGDSYEPEPINLPLGYTRETYEAELARRARIYANWGKTT